MGFPVNKALVGYAAALTTVLAVVTVGQAVSQPKVQAIDTLDVQRINLREADGTLRLVIANKAQFPGAIFKGKEYPHASRNDAAGMIFFNDEGTENGGLIFGGKKSPEGKVTSFGHLSFDQYEQDQVVNLEQGENDGHRAAGLSVNDMPSESMDIASLSKLEGMKDGPEKAAMIKKLVDAGAGGRPRMFIGKREGSSMLSLKDAAGKERLRMRVTPQGDASIEFVDAAGKVVRTVTPTAG